MTLFWITAAGLIVLAILFIVPPLLRFKPKEEASLDEVNLAIIKQQLVELKADLEAGELDQDQYDAARHDLEKELLADTGSGEDITSGGEPKSGRWIMVALPIAVPALALSLYFNLGSPDIIPRSGEPSSVQNAGQSDPGQTMASMEELVEKLAQRMENEPDNAQGWKMLGRSYLAMNRMDDAIKAYEKAYKLDPQDVDLILGYATTLARKNDNTFAGLPGQLIEMAYNLEPGNTNIHWLKGNVHYQMGEFAKAVALWEKVMATLDPNSQEGMTVSQYLNDARSKLPQGAATAASQAPTPPQSSSAAAGSGSIRVEVNLDPALRDKVQDSDKVFIFARALQGPRMPLAAVRREVMDLPLTLALDDSMAMTAQLVLSNFSEVIVEARVSKSGDPVAQSGDIEGQFSPVKPGQQETVQVTINQVHP